MNLQPVLKKIIGKLRSRRILIPCVVMLLLIALLAVILCRRQPPSIAGGDYACGIGFEGLRVKRIIQAFDLKETTGMGGAYYDEAVAQAVSDFQKDQGLNITGEVDLNTWKAIGFTEAEWELCGTYQSPARADESSGREERVEALISRAYDYLGDPYVIGASGPAGPQYGLDCSGLVIQALYAAGVAMDDINPVTHAQPGHEYESRNIWESSHFTIINAEDMERGDLVFYGNSQGIVTHIAIYLGDGEVIESWPNEVRISPLADESRQNIIGVKRVFE